MATSSLDLQPKDGHSEWMILWRRVHKKLGIDKDTLKDALWGDFYFDPSTKMILDKSETGGRRRTLFAALILETIWSVYLADATKRASIAKALNLTFDPKLGIRSLMSAWLPLSHKTIQHDCEQDTCSTLQGTCIIIRHQF